MPRNCLSVSDHFEGLVLKGLRQEAWVLKLYHFSSVAYHSWLKFEKRELLLKHKFVPTYSILYDTFYWKNVAGVFSQKLNKLRSNWPIEKFKCAIFFSQSTVDGMLILIQWSHYVLTFHELSWILCPFGSMLGGI